MNFRILGQKHQEDIWHCLFDKEKRSKSNFEAFNLMPQCVAKKARLSCTMIQIQFMIPKGKKGTTILMYLFICLYYLNLFLFSKFLQKPIFALGGKEGRKVAKEEKICFALTLQ